MDLNKVARLNVTLVIERIAVQIAFNEAQAWNRRRRHSCECLSTTASFLRFVIYVVHGEVISLSSPRFI